MSLFRPGCGDETVAGNGWPGGGDAVSGARAAAWAQSGGEASESRRLSPPGPRPARGARASPWGGGQTPLVGRSVAARLPSPGREREGRPDLDTHQIGDFQWLKGQAQSGRSRCGETAAPQMGGGSACFPPPSRRQQSCKATPRREAGQRFGP